MKTALAWTGDMLSSGMRQRIVREFQSAGRRLLLLDYDGTLVPIRPTPEQATPAPGLLAILGRLARIGDVVIVSGRTRAALDAWLGMGDDATDEDLFRVLPPSAYSIRVGLTQSYARYNVADQAEALSVVESLADSPLDAA